MPSSRSGPVPGILGIQGSNFPFQATPIVGKISIGRLEQRFPFRPETKRGSKVQPDVVRFGAMEVVGRDRRASETPPYDAKFSTAMRMVLPRSVGPSDTRNAPVRGVTLAVASILGLIFFATGYLVLNAARRGEVAAHEFDRLEESRFNAWVEYRREDEAFLKAKRIGGVGFHLDGTRHQVQDHPEETFSWMASIRHALRASGVSRGRCDLYKVGIVGPGSSFNVGKECPQGCTAVAWGAAAKWRVKSSKNEHTGEFFVDEEQTENEVFVVPVSADRGGIVSSMKDRYLNLYLCTSGVDHRGMHRDGPLDVEASQEGQGG